MLKVNEINELLYKSYFSIIHVTQIHVVKDSSCQVSHAKSVSCEMKQRVSMVAGACFHHLRRLRLIRRHVSNEFMAQLIYALITSKLGYCNSIVACLPASAAAHLKRVQNAAARLLLNYNKQ